MSNSEILPSLETIDLNGQIIIFIGPEGSGKTTLAKRLSTASGKPRIATGDLIRVHASDPSSPYQNACQLMLDNSDYLDPHLMMQIIAEAILEHDAENGFILDGGLRTKIEVNEFPQMLSVIGRDDLPVSVISLRLPVWQAVERCLERGRPDDNPRDIFSRMRIFTKIWEFVPKQ